MQARVMTFHPDREHMPGLVNSLSLDLPRAYQVLPGFRGLLVLENPGSPGHVIALTLWEGEEGLTASETFAEGFAKRISLATGTEVTRGIYEVVESLGITYREGGTE